ncbi:coxsackievirus and adenovirus receptor homolog [Osmerus eperlanus]|uniref:coxsackievirus and adenovirus receptor homolog n=1 Tax=Osmerus eperlanus TaxID=29151 RepID=UPI002E0E3024
MLCFGGLVYQTSDTSSVVAKFITIKSWNKPKGMDLTIFHLCCLLISTIAGSVQSLEITSTGPTSIEKASGQTVKLDCQFSLGPEDSGPLDIEWSLLASDNQKEDKVVILYSGDRAYEDYYPAVKGRAHFNSADPKNGDASINLTGLKSSDTGTYQCKVKKAPGIRSRKMLLTVMVRPSKPRCYAEGPTEEGKDVALRCTSSEGTNPLQYKWEKTSDTKLLPTSAVLDPVGGTMNVRNASTGSSGTYRCTVQNRVGMEECIMQLSITPPPNTAGIIAGAIIAVLLALILLAIILFCCCRARNRKKYEKEISYEIREDVPPPKSRVSTARSFTSVGSQRSSLGSMSPSNLHEYAIKPQYDKIPSSSEDYDRPPSRAPLPPPVAAKMAGPNLSRMGAIPVMIPAQNRDGSIV